MNTEPLGDRALSKLKWRCRRGLLENDLFIERFFFRHESGLTQAQAQGLNVLMDLADNDLLDVLLGRKALEPALQTEEVMHVLSQLRMPGTPAQSDHVTSTPVNM